MTRGHIPPRPIPAPAPHDATGGQVLAPTEARERVFGASSPAPMPATVRAQLALVERWALAAGGSPDWLIDPDQTGEMLVNTDVAARVHWRCAQDLLQACASGMSAAELLSNIEASARIDGIVSTDGGPLRFSVVGDEGAEGCVMTGPTTDRKGAGCQ